MYFLLLAAALVTARARISALEAKLKASREAWKSANVAKVFAEKVAKSAETRAKKAEKTLADADQKRAKREQSIAERLDKIFIFVGYLLMLSFADICLLILFVSLWYNKEDWGILEALSAKY
jgi:hypothetical protein